MDKSKTQRTDELSVEDKTIQSATEELLIEGHVALIQDELWAAYLVMVKLKALVEKLLEKDKGGLTEHEDPPRGRGRL